MTEVTKQMSDLSMIRKLRESHIPPYTFKTNFEVQGMTMLRDRITSTEFTDAYKSGNPISLYLHARNDTPQARRRSILATGLAAKALCIQGAKVTHVHLAGFLREQRMAEMERESNSVNPVMSRIGRGGYIAISDFLEYPDVNERYGYHSMQLVADYLMEHLEAGGGLILGAADVGPLDVSQYGTAFSACMDMFEAVQV